MGNFLNKFGLIIGCVLIGLNNFVFANPNTDTKVILQKTIHNEPLFKDGKGYYSYKERVNDKAIQSDKVHIQYFFEYDCKICSEANDYLQQYALRNKDKVVLVRSPSFDKDSQFTAQMHSTFMEIGREDLSELYLFDSVGRKNEKSLIRSNNAIITWLKQKGIDVVKFNKVFLSEQVRQRVQQYKDIFLTYRPSYKPMAVLDGKYILVRNTLYNDDYTYAVLDFLVEKLQQEKQEDKK
ncbi:thiol:disulfide interchange protein DsbA/DsbL [Actinobacillus genomosp. 2]|uniref:thiol:disulfide interchange protein DsbA/DsbL n=1 Tax=Actinobacillus genomosp. 2 TaxID=230709 RepID=UPI00244211AF|nr:thiol:disulfide interchange protein DsbA/DsbL [Actinobacillus genomosp. 2]WGE31692.1 thiol:disulfide interchange protein DsbA/DsbL [Actinobacillus genomosp. 2]